MHDPRLIVCDEPTSALDSETGRKVMELMRQLAVGNDRALIVVTHDARIFDFADRIAQMEDGVITRVLDSPEEMQTGMLRNYVSKIHSSAPGAGWRCARDFRRCRAPTKPSARAPVSEAPQPPYQTFVAGAGHRRGEHGKHRHRHADRRNRFKDLCADRQPGESGRPLFTIDDRAQRALIATDTAAVKAAQAQMEQAKYELGLGEELIGKKSDHSEDLETRTHAADTAEAQFVQAQANLEAAKTDLERLTVRAPVDGQVMQLKVHLGEFAPTGVLSPAAHSVRRRRADERAGGCRRERCLARARDAPRSLSARQQSRSERR